VTANAAILSYGVLDKIGEEGLLMRFRFLAATAAFAVGVVVSGVGGSASAAPAAPQATKVTNVRVVMEEYTFTLSKNVVPRGRVVFTVINNGDLGHDFVIGALNKKTPVIQSGGRRTLIVNFTKRGRFLYLCSVGEHFFHGMKGYLRVK
jgi:uncharacterized cupredoxin-like copper-binding protein